MTTAWPVVRLHEVAEVRLGRQRSPKNHQGHEMRPYVRAANVGWRGLRLDDVKWMNFTDAEMAVYGLQPGDLLLNEASGSAREVGKPAIWSGEIDGCAFQNTLIRVRPIGPDPRYLLHYFAEQASSGAFARKSRGVGIHYLGREALATWPIPLPPIEEQRRIAAVLDQADELRAKRQTSLALLNSLNAAIFLDMFGDPASNPRDWPTAPLGALCIIAGEYGAPVPSAPLVDGGPRYVRITDIGADGYLTDGAVGPAGGANEWSRYTLEPGDLLFARSGATVGKTYLHGPTEREHVFAGYLIRFRPDPRQVNPVFLYHFTRSSAYRKWVENKQRAVAQPNINAKQYGSELMVPLPPLELQQEFAKRNRLVAKHRVALGGSSGVLDALLSSLQHRAFAGQL